MEMKVNQQFSQWVGAVIKLAHKEEQGLSWRQTSETSFQPLVSSLDFSTLFVFAQSFSYLPTYNWKSCSCYHFLFH